MQVINNRCRSPGCVGHSRKAKAVQRQGAKVLLQRLIRSFRLKTPIWQWRGVIRPLAPKVPRLRRKDLGRIQARQLLPDGIHWIKSLKLHRCKLTSTDVGVCYADFFAL